MNRLRPFPFQDMKITIKNIIRWEQLRGKTFSEFDTSDTDDVIALMYVTTPDKTLGGSLFETYWEVVQQRPKLVEKHSDEISRYLDYINQFSAKAEQEPEDPMALHTEESEKPDKTSIGDVAMNLLYSGVDAHYLMDEAELCDLPMLGKGAEERMHRRMEESRLWTYLSLQPYISEKDKIRRASDLYPFPWEEKGKPVIVSDEDMAMAESILYNNGKEAN